MAAPPARAEIAEVSPATSERINLTIEQGRELYRSGRYGSAIATWSEAMAISSQQGNVLQQVVVSSYLALAYQQLGQLDRAAQTIAQGQQALQAYSGDRTERLYQLAAAQLSTTQGSLYFTQGQAEAALTAWQQAAIAYGNAGDEAHRVTALINQAQAQQSLGLYLQAQRTLSEVERSLQQQSDLELQLAGWHSLGNVLRRVGDLDASQRVLQEALTVAQSASPQNRGLILMSLGNTARSQQDWQAALGFYQQAATLAATPLLGVQSRLNQMSLLIEMEQYAQASQLISQIQPVLEELPNSRAAIYAQINLAQSLIQLAQQPSVRQPQASAISQAAQLLADATQNAKELGDSQAEAYALGHLGGVYEQTEQWAIAQRLTEQALLLAQANNSPEIAYQWQWQLGRILKAQAKPTEATIAYKAAFETLQTLRSDLVAIDASVQFSFRESVEPVYRDYVNLLLSTPAVTSDQSNLKQAREVMESLQLAELTNFFRSACLEGQIVALDQVDQSEAAVIYPILLDDRLEIILSLPQQPLQRYTSPVPQAQIETAVDELRQNLERPFTTPQGRLLGQQMYDWLLRPMATALSQSQVKVLVFVLDGALRNVPLAALHTGDEYLIQSYAVAIAPGLQLLNPQPLRRQNLEVLAAGLSEERYGFSALTNVERELEQIQAELPSQILLNRAFTSEALQAQINALPFPIVHLATHGQFSSNLDDTFILAWDKPIPISELSGLLRTSDEVRSEAIELLVLSACETAAGDNRAALGLAGIAVQAGARSTLASLWTVDDASGAQFISRFYQELATANVTKAEALRRAQLSLLNDPDFRTPLHWASYVLVGNWL